MSGWRRALQAIGRLTIGTVIVAGAGFYYVAHQERTPGTQLPHDPTKKTLVVLGSGWGATSFLKKLDTTEYNVVSTFARLFRSASNFTQIQVVISPHNYFLFTPLLPSVSTGTLSPKSIISREHLCPFPMQSLSRHQRLVISLAIRRVKLQSSKLKPSRSMSVFRSTLRSALSFSNLLQATNKTVTFSDASEIKGAVSTTTIPYDYLVYAVGAETQTFGIPGVREHACFMKELQDAEKVSNRH